MAVKTKNNHLSYIVLVHLKKSILISKYTREKHKKTLDNKKNRQVKSSIYVLRNAFLIPHSSLKVNK